jgi:NagD protein
VSLRPQGRVIGSDTFERAAAGKRGRHVLNAIAASNRELLHTRRRLLGRLHTILVLTGSTIPDDVERHPYRPSRIVDSVADLLAELEEEAIAPTPG